MARKFVEMRRLAWTMRRTRRTAWLACCWSAVTVGCASTSAVPNAAAPRHSPTCRSAVHVFADADSVGAAFQELAAFTVAHGIITDSTAILTSLRDKTAKLGGNGLIARRAVPHTVRDASGEWVMFEAAAIYIPSDTARIAGECAE